MYLLPDTRQTYNAARAARSKGHNTALRVLDEAEGDEGEESHRAQGRHQILDQRGLALFGFLLQHLAVIGRHHLSEKENNSVLTRVKRSIPF